MARARGGRVSRIEAKKPTRLRAYTTETLTEKVLNWFLRKIAEAERERDELLQEMRKNSF